jgi:hypothetical protein
MSCVWRRRTGTLTTVPTFVDCRIAHFAERDGKSEGAPARCGGCRSPTTETDPARVTGP